MHDGSLLDEMRTAVRGDRERAEARRKAQVESVYSGPPTLDLKRSTRELRSANKSQAEQPLPEPAASEPDETEEAAADPESRLPARRRILARLSAFFRR
jgi:hypothetical protein